jgi:hypothetical protein
MKIECQIVEEHPDGSATMTVSLDNDGMRFLINLGIVTALKEVIANHKELEPYEESDNEVCGE